MGTPDVSSGEEQVPQRTEMEQRFKAKVVTYESGGVALPGGMCSCCGSGPDANADFNGGDPWYIYRCGLRDGDGVYYSMACQDCLEDLRFQHSKRPQTEADEVAREITELMGDDLDGAQAMMEDLQALGEDAQQSRRGESAAGPSQYRSFD